MNELLNSPLIKGADFNYALWWKRISKGNIQARYISPFTIILHQEGTYPKIGEGTWIGHFTIIDGSQGLEIGENCSISSGVHIYTHSVHKRVLYDMPKEVSPTRIGNNVFIGPNTVISMGCDIGDRVHIAPLSFIGPNTTIPSNAKVEGRFTIKRFHKDREE